MECSSPGSPNQSTSASISPPDPSSSPSTLASPQKNNVEHSSKPLQKPMKTHKSDTS